MLQVHSASSFRLQDVLLHEVNLEFDMSKNLKIAYNQLEIIDI
jgi:hypothetical protein